MYCRHAYFGKSDDEQRRKMEKLRETSGLDYRIPKLIEVVTSVFMSYIPHCQSSFYGTTFCSEKNTVDGKTYQTNATYSEGIYLGWADESEILYGCISPVVRLSN